MVGKKNGTPRPHVPSPCRSPERRSREERARVEHGGIMQETPKKRRETNNTSLSLLGSPPRAKLWVPINVGPLALGLLAP